jgi:hypothetical protein
MLADEQLFFAKPMRCRGLQAENALASGRATVGLCAPLMSRGLQDLSDL